MRRGNYNRAVIRRLLLDAFTPDDLVRFCQDRDKFRHFTEYMPTPLSLVSAVDVLIERCEKELLILELLREVQEYNPAQYEKFEHKLFFPSEPGESKADIRTPVHEPKESISSPPHSPERQHLTSVPTSQATAPQAMPCDGWSPHGKG